MIELTLDQITELIRKSTDEEKRRFITLVADMIDDLYSSEEEINDGLSEDLQSPE